MSDSSIARRYAGALIAEALQNGATESVDADVALLGESLADSRDLVLFFASPVVSREQKSRVVEVLFADRIQPVTLQFLQLLVRKRREELLQDVVSAYRDLRDAELGIVQASAQVARPLDAEEEKNLIDSLEGLSGKQVRLTTENVPDLMGGIVVRIGDTVYDGSIRNRLNMLRGRLEQGSFSSN